MEEVHAQSHLVGQAKGQWPGWGAGQVIPQGLNGSSSHELHHYPVSHLCLSSCHISLIKSINPEHKLTGNFFHVISLFILCYLFWHDGARMKRGTGAEREQKKQSCMNVFPLKSLSSCTKKCRYLHIYQALVTGILMATSKPQSLCQAL